MLYSPLNDCKSLLAQGGEKKSEFQYCRVKSRSVLASWERHWGVRCQPICLSLSKRSDCQQLAKSEIKRDDNRCVFCASLVRRLSTLSTRGFILTMRNICNQFEWPIKWNFTQETELKDHSWKYRSIYSWFLFISTNKINTINRQNISYTIRNKNVVNQWIQFCVSKIGAGH